MTNGPKKAFLKLANGVSEALLYSYSIPDNDRRVLGWIIRWSWGVRGQDWVQASRQDMEKELGMSRTSLRRSLDNLLCKNVIRRRGRGVRGDSYEYSPQKFVQFWKYDLLSPARPIYEPKEDDSEEYEQALESFRNKGPSAEPLKKIKGGQNRENKGPKSRNKGAASGPETSAQTRANTSPIRADRQYRQYRQDPPLPPTGVDGDVFKDSGEQGSEGDSVRIMSPKEANGSDITADEAAIQAELAYCREYVGPVRRRERRRLREKMGAARPGAMLGVWLLALEEVKRERQAARAEGRSTWKSLFCHAEDCFQRIYESKRNGSKPAKKPPSYWDNEIEPQRRMQA